MATIKNFNRFNKSNNHWSLILFEACSKFESKYPDGLKKLEGVTTQNIGSILNNYRKSENESELAKLYREASTVVVEPDQYLGLSSQSVEETMEEYIQIWEKRKANTLLQYLDGLDKKGWENIIEIVSVEGY